MPLDKRLLQQAKLAQTNLVLTIVLGYAAFGVVVVQAFYLSRIINQVFLEGQSLFSHDKGVWQLLLILFGLSLLRAGLVWSSQVTAQRVAGQIKNHLRERLTTHLFTLGPTYTQGERSGELTNTAIEGIEALDAYFSQYIPQLAMSVLIPVTMLMVVFPLDFISGLVLLLTAPLIPIFMILIGSWAETLTNRQWISLSRMSAHFLDVLQGLTTLKLLGRSRQQIETIALISDRFRQTTMEVLRVAFLSALVLELVSTLSTAIVAVEIGLRLLYGHLAFEQAFFVLILAPEFYLPLRQLGTRFHAGLSGVTAIRRIFEILETASANKKAQFLQKTELLFPLKTIHFDNVHYVYDDGTRPALKSVSFTIDLGQKIAVVGPSGAGKSTLVQLLLRFIEPQQGHILVNGLPLNDFELSAWRAQVAWLPQQPYLFHVSVIENLRLANPKATMEQVRWATHQANATTFIEALPQGYDTIIGERGARLSGGQAQRLALARAFLKDAPFLILDESTANLDPEQESQIQAAMKQLLHGRTALIIAHRLKTIYQADQILVMSAGQIIERGTHDGLLQQRGLYHRLVKATN